MPFQPIDSQRLYQRVADQIGDLIRAGEFTPGQRLPPERDLSKKLGVSRPVVREAMIALELAGLIEVRIGSGTFVREAVEPTASIGDSGHSPYDIMTSRMTIETQIAALAAQNIGKEKLAELAALVEAMDRPDAPHDPESDLRFHVGIAEATGNAVLAAVVTWLWQIQYSPMFTILSERVSLEANREATVIGHRAILDALRAGDPAAASASMLAHLSQVRDVIAGDATPAE